MLNQKVRLRAGSQYIVPKIQTVQADTGRVLVCEIEDLEIPGGATATFWAMKPSGKSVQNDAQIPGQEVMVELTNQTLAEQGYVKCQIEIELDGDSVKTFEFLLDNGISLAGDWPKSENENTYLEGVVAEMQAKLTETINQANAATSAANTATQSANTATANANAAADEARQTIWNNKNLTNNTSASESQVETAAGAAVLTGVDGKTFQDGTPTPDVPIPVRGVGGETGDESFGFNAAVQSYQLFDASKFPTKSAGGVTVTNNGDGSFTVSGSGKLTSTFNFSGQIDKSVFKIGKITLKCQSTYPYFRVRFINGSGNEILRLSSERTSEDVKQLTEDILENTNTVAIEIYGGANFDIFSGTTKPMLYQNGDGTFQKYHRSELPFTLTQPLFDGDKIMQVKAGQTYVDADGATQTADRDLWGIERSSFIVNGNEKRFIINKAWTDRNEKFIFGYITDYSSYTKQGNILCNALPYHYFGVAPENVTEECVQTLKETSGVPLYVAINRERVDSIDQTGIETYMKTANMIFVMNYTTTRFIPFSDQSPFFGWTTPTGGCTITTDDPMEPIISADTAQTPEGSYLLTGYIDGLRARNNETVIAALSNQVVALTQKSMEG